MTLNELINKLHIAQGNNNVDELTPEVINMLRQQEQTIERYYQMLRDKDVNIEYLREKLIASIDDIKTLKTELEDCTCQGGHSEAYLKAKGKL
jgi:hypothetical protein